MGIFKDLAPAVRKETKRVAVMTAVGVILMWVIFAAGHAIAPGRIPFNWTVLLGGLCGGAVAVLNFLMMGITVQKAASAPDEDSARLRVRASYSRRMMMQMLWVVLAIVLPCFQFAAGILPLLFPSTGIKILALTGRINSSGRS